MGAKPSVALTAALLLTGLAVGSANAQENPTVSARNSASPGNTVTLITGDKVVVQGEHVVAVRMAAGREHVRYWQYQVAGHDYVVPEDAINQVMQDKLDKRLFDVTGLVEQQYDDAHEPNVPTVVTNARSLTQGVRAVDTPKSQAARAWREHAQAAAPQKIWLNGRVHATLDQSVPQVGGPVAWQAGFRGDGATVAVLDTGYDPAHPDLKSVVDKSADFTGVGIQDKAGHGTHVASTIAGSGAASNGRYKGVAPGAHLLIGKVLDNFGGGREDWIINGMNWAVQQGARVINMSFGGDPSDGTDLMSETVNQLSSSSGALFVIAAGNSGARGTVDTPGAADRALTVANVTKQDQLSTTSSQGPRIGDFGLKPEIAAPGTDIVAARAAGTLTASSVNQDYARISGTSMATPHVAGAAAILAGEHPDWTGQQIKDTLIGSAKRLPGIDTFAQGSGRLDIGRGATQQVRVAGLAGFGEIVGQKDVSKTVTYTNDSANPVTLTLTLDVNRPDAVTTDKTVTVPAHSSTAVAVTAHGSTQPLGDLSGVLRAQSGDVVLNTPVTGELFGDKHTLTVQVPPRTGNSLFALVVVQNEQTGQTVDAFTDTDTATFSLPTGHYRVLGRVMDSTFADTMFELPANVDKDSTLTVDTKQGKPVTATLDDPSARGQAGGGQLLLSTVGGSSAGIARPGNGVPASDSPLYTVGGPAMSGLMFADLSYWTYPWAVTRVNGPDGFEFHDTYAPFDMGFTGDLTGRLVDVGEAATDDINKAGDVRDAIAIIVPHDWSRPIYPSQQQLLDGIALLKDKGAKAVLSFFNPVTDASSVRPALPTAMAFYKQDLQGAQNLMRQRTVEATLTVRPNSPVAYFLADKVTGAMPAGHVFAFHKESLGVIDRQLVDTMAPDTYRYGVAAWSVDGVTAGADVETKWPQHRLDYVTPGAAFSFYVAGGFNSDGDTDGETSLPVVLKQDEKRPSRMLGAPFGPELTVPPTSRQDGKPVPWAYRQGDKLTLAVPMFADASPDDASQFDSSVTGSTVLLKDGKEIGRRNDVPALGTFDIPAGPGRYRLIADAQRDASTFVPALSPRTRAEWTFSADAGTSTRAALPLLDVRYDLSLDEHNTAAAGKPLVGRVSVATQPGARASYVPWVFVEYSYDDGKTWQRAKVFGSRLEIPAGSGPFVSLRASAFDLGGNYVTETVIHAYAVK